MSADKGSQDSPVAGPVFLLCPCDEEYCKLHTTIQYWNTTLHILVLTSWVRVNHPVKNKTMEQWDELCMMVVDLKIEKQNAITTIPDVISVFSYTYAENIYASSNLFEQVSIHQNNQNFKLQWYDYLFCRQITSLWITGWAEGHQRNVRKKSSVLMCTSPISPTKNCVDMSLPINNPEVICSTFLLYKTLCIPSLILGESTLIIFGIENKVNSLVAWMSHSNMLAIYC